MVNIMNKIKWQKVYQNNQRLDSIFYQKYSSDNDLYRKNCIEILVELGEFVNESKVFKYWTNKTPNKNKILEEYADVITMCLYFMNEFKMELDDRYLHIGSNDILEVINYLFNKMSLLMNNNDQELLKDIFGNVLYLGKILEFSEEEIIDVINKKHQIIEERLKSDY